jgi:hypothetical protein
MNLKITSVTVCVLVGLMGAALTSQAAIIITEIMYNPADTGDAYEYVEIYNNGVSAVDLTGWTIADTGATNSGPFPAGSSIAAGGTAVLPRLRTGFGTIADYKTAWGAGINFIDIPIDTWNGLANTPDEVLIYDASNTLITEVDYGVASPWPPSTNGFSIYLTDLSADTSVGSNWALSAVGVDGAYAASPPFDVGDVGSPGVVVPEPTTLALVGLGLLVVLLSHRDMS